MPKFPIEATNHGERLNDPQAWRQRNIKLVPGRSTPAPSNSFLGSQQRAYANCECRDELLAAAGLMRGQPFLRVMQVSRIVVSPEFTQDFCHP